MDEATQDSGNGSATAARGMRRRHSKAQKVAIVRQCLEPGTSLAGVALAHRVNANMVRKWVVKYQQGGYGQPPMPGMELLPVVLKPPSVLRATAKSAAATATIEIELARGVVRLSGPLDRAVLQLLLDALSA